MTEMCPVRGMAARLPASVDILWVSTDLWALLCTLVATALLYPFEFAWRA